MLLLLFPTDRTVSLICIGVIVALSLFLHLRVPFGLDGSDQMLLLIFVALFLQSSFPDDAIVTNACLWFIALQACLSYTTAGIAKLVSPVWRSGDAMFLITNTQSYGTRAISALLLEYPVLSSLMAWIVITFECVFPLALVLGIPGCFAILTWGVLFHVGNGLLMGLNTFIWAFLATYPAIVYCSLQVQGVIEKVL